LWARYIEFAVLKQESDDVTIEAVIAVGCDEREACSANCALTMSCVCNLSVTNGALDGQGEAFPHELGVWKMIPVFSDCH